MGTKRLRLQLFSIAGTIARRSRRVWLPVRARITPAPVRRRRDPAARPPTTHLTSTTPHQASTTGTWNPAPTQVTKGGSTKLPPAGWRNNTRSIAPK